jgi:hypothetical protein
MPGIHAFGATKQGVDGRDRPGHDGGEIARFCALRYSTHNARP